MNNGNISPFNWGYSENEILKIIPDWKVYFDNSRELNYPYLTIDNVEFYFEKDNFQKLDSIVIGVWKIDQNYKSDFFIHDWIRDDLSIPKVRKILKNQNRTFEEAWVEKWGNFYILPNRYTRLAFNSTGYDEFNENETELQKVFISERPLTDEEINNKGIKVTLYNKGHDDHAS